MEELEGRHSSTMLLKTNSPRLSGKSSLLSALFRLIELDSGKIYIDGVDISTIPRSKVLSQLIAVPQDPFFIPGTSKYNLDPSDIATTTQMITCLEKVGLWKIISDQGGLDIDLNAIRLSHGQKQLLCLTRAILRAGSNSVLVLDEAASNIDKTTDDKMQEIIREMFAKHTVITVAHRASTILDYDVVIVLDQGRIVEIGPPKELMENKGLFWELDFGSE